MRLSSEFESAAEAVAAAEAVLTSLAELPRPQLHADRLSLIGRLQTVVSQASSLLALWVAEADRQDSAGIVAGTKMTQWLTTTGNADPREAAQLLNIGKDILFEPELRDAALKGDVSPGQVRAIKQTLRELPASLSDGQRDEARAILIDKAKTMTPGALAKQSEAVLEVVAPDRGPDEALELRKLARQRARAVTRRSLRYVTEDGSMIFTASLPLLEGESLVRLLDAYRGSARREDTAVPVTWAQSYADALVAIVNIHGSSSGVPSLAGDRPRVVVTMNEEALHSRAEQAGVLGSGEKVDAGTLRRLTCDADLTPVVLGSDSAVLDMGVTVRLVTPEIRQALSVRDGGCAFPDCTTPDASCEAHHIQPWWAGGPTSLANLVLLCRHHHGVIEPARFWAKEPPDKWSVKIDETGKPVFTPPVRLGAFIPDG